MLRAVLPALLMSLLSMMPAGAWAGSHDPGWFATLQYGNAKYDVSLERGTEPWWGNVDSRGDTVAFGIGYDFVPQLGLRLMYERTGSIRARNVCPDGVVCAAVVFRESTRADNVSLVLMPRMHLGDTWEAYATVGAMRWRIDPVGAINRDRGTLILYGAGLGVRLASGVGIAAEYQQSLTDYDALRLNLSVHF